MANISDEITKEILTNPDKALWLVEKILPGFEKIFEDFNADNLLAELTDNRIDSQRIKNVAKLHANRKGNTESQKENKETEKWSIIFANTINYNR